jgi:hypothetical protein
LKLGLRGYQEVSDRPPKGALIELVAFVSFFVTLRFINHIRLLIVIITPALVYKVRILFRLEHSVLEKIFAKSLTQRYGH